MAFWSTAGTQSLTTNDVGPSQANYCTALGDAGVMQASGDPLPMQFAPSHPDGPLLRVHGA